MPIMKVETVVKKVPALKSPMLSVNELIVLMSCSLYDNDDHHFDAMAEEVKDDVLNLLCTSWRYHVEDGRTHVYLGAGKAYTITTYFEDRTTRDSIMVCVKENCTGDSWLACYTCDELAENYEMIEYEGDDWDDVEW